MSPPSRKRQKATRLENVNVSTPNEKRGAMAEFRTVCRVGDLAPGEGRTVEVGGKLIAVFREGNRYFAIDDVCPHMGASLSGGYLESGIVTCPWHAWRFRLAD